MSPAAWLDLDRLSDAERVVAVGFLGAPLPGAVSGTAMRSIDAAVPMGADYFNLGCTDGRATWGVIATRRRGAVVVSAEVAKAARVPGLPVALARIAVKLGPKLDRMSRAEEAASLHPDDDGVRADALRESLEYAALRERLAGWHFLPSPTPQ